MGTSTTADEPLEQVKYFIDRHPKVSHINIYIAACA